MREHSDSTMSSSVRNISVPVISRSASCISAGRGFAVRSGKKRRTATLWVYSIASSAETISDAVPMCPANPPLAAAAEAVSHLLRKAPKGGMPTRATEKIAKTAQVQGMRFASPSRS